MANTYPPPTVSSVSAASIGQNSITLDAYLTNIPVATDLENGANRGRASGYAWLGGTMVASATAEGAADAPSGWSAGMSFTGLSPGTTYNFQIIAVSTRGDGQTSAAYSVNFTTASPPPPSPPAPALNAPASGSTISYGAANVFSWTASTAYGGQNYAYLTYRKVGTSTWTTVSINGNTQNYTFPAGTFAPSTNYEWRVQTRCASYNTWSGYSTTWTFTTTGAVQAPILNNPVNDLGSKATDDLIFDWTFQDPTPGETQTRADFQYRNITDNGAWVVLNNVATTENTYTVLGGTFTPGKQYEWQVKTWNSTLEGPWSASNKFYAIAPPAAPTALTPADVSMIQTSTPNLSATRLALPPWQPARFEWQFATDSGFTTDVVTYLQTTEGFAAGTVTDKLPAASRLAQRDWYVRVRQLDKFDQYSDYSTAVNHFTISHLPTTNTYSPTATQYIAATTTNVFSWRFADTSETDTQTAFQVVCERNDTGVLVFDTGKVASTVSSYTQDLTTAPKDTVLRWRIKVWDTDDKAGSFSSYQLFLVGDRAVITVTPGNEAIVNSGAPQVTWDLVLGGTRYQTSWSVTFTDRATNQVVHSASGTEASTRAYTPPYSILVNGRDYSITVAIQDSANLGATVISTVHTQFDSPEVVVYIVNPDSVNENGYVLVDWSATHPDPDFVNWKVYRRASGLASWELLEEISDITVSQYHDWAVQSGSVYQYTVTQTVVRFGIVLESPLGYRATWLPVPRINLSPNPSADIGIASWSEFDGYGGTSEITRETTDSHLGAGYARITYSVAPTSTRFGGLQQDFDAVEQTVYTCSAWVRQNQAVMLHAGIYNADIVVTDVMKPETLVADEWVKISVSAIAPAGLANSLTFVVYASADVTDGYTLDVDAVLIEQSDTVGEYFDGYSSGAHWDGTTGLSTSTLDKLIVAEGTSYRVDINEYWILNYADSTANVSIPNVTSDDYTEEWEEETYTLIGRGRKKDYGTRLGRSGTLSAQIRGYDGIPKVKRLQLNLLKELQQTYYLRTPFGDLIPVGLGNISIKLIAGTGLAEMYDVSIPYEELAVGVDEQAGSTTKRPARMQVVDNGDGTLTLIPLAESDINAVGGDIVEINL